jgi:SAM-dependent methyltransferase
VNRHDLTEERDERDLVEAIHAGSLPAYARGILDDPDATPAQRRRAQRALAACERIGVRIDAERSRVLELLDDAGTPASSLGPSGPAQRHVITLGIAPERLASAVAALEREGYQRQHRWSPGAERSLVRTGHELVVTASDDATTVVRLRWAAPRRPGRIARILRPTAADWDMIDLPASAWWVYTGVRPLRLALERTGMRARDHGALEPFLVTPSSLVEPLLDAAQVGPSDVLLDFGCGDGRFLVEAAGRRGCRAIGVEQSARLVAAASERRDRAGLHDRIRIVHADGLDAPLDDVTVVVMFLPMRIAQRVVPALIDRLPGGSRLLLHEQGRLHEGLPEPDRSTAVIGQDAVTVAHRWDVPDER